jgi:hypothetical protein
MRTSCTVEACVYISQAQPLAVPSEFDCIIQNSIVMSRSITLLTDPNPSMDAVKTLAMARFMSQHAIQIDPSDVVRIRSIPTGVRIEFFISHN